LIFVVFFFFLLVFSFVYYAYINAIVFCYWCKGSRTRQSERIKSIFRTTASKPTIHIDLTGSGSDSGTATIGGAATGGGHAIRGGAAARGGAATQGGHAIRGGVATRGGHAFRGGETSGAASRGGANPTADAATKGKRIVVTVEKAIEIAEEKRKRRKPDWKI
jgi:hypothetical protein